MGQANLSAPSIELVFTVIMAWLLVGKHYYLVKIILRPLIPMDINKPNFEAIFSTIREVSSLNLLEFWLLSPATFLKTFSKGHVIGLSEDQNVLMGLPASY